MDLVFAAEQYAQAQAAVAAAAQYYTNAAISAANGPIAPATPIMVTSAAAPIGLLPAQAVAAAAAGHPPGSAIISGTQVLGPQFLNAALATPTPLPQAPPPPPISVQASSSINQPRVNMIGGNSDNDKRGVIRDSDNRERRRDNRDRHDRDHKYDRERGLDRDNYRSERHSRYDRDRDRDRRGDRDRNYDKRDRDDRRRRDRSPGRRNRSRSPYRRERERDCTPDSEDTDKDIPPNNTIMVRGLAQHIAESDIEDSIRSCGLQAKDIRLIRKKETGKVINI